MALEPPGRAAFQPSDSECCRAAPVLPSPVTSDLRAAWGPALHPESSPGPSPWPVSPLGSPQLLSLRAGPIGKHVSVEKVYRSLGPLLQENTFLLPKPSQVAFLLGFNTPRGKDTPSTAGLSGLASQAASPARSRSCSLSPLGSFPCGQDPKRVVSLPRPSWWVREPSSLNKQQRCLPGPSLCTPSPWPFRKTFRTDSRSAPAPRPMEFQPPESSPGVPPPTTALTELLLGGRGALEPGGTHRAGTGKTLAQPKGGWEGKRGAKGHRWGGAWATLRGVGCHSRPPPWAHESMLLLHPSPDGWPRPCCLDAALQTAPLSPLSPAQDHVGR